MTGERSEDDGECVFCVLVTDLQAATHGQHRLPPVQEPRRLWGGAAQCPGVSDVRCAQGMSSPF